jgi:V8-like Glu-specific endopeptidase
MAGLRLFSIGLLLLAAASGYSSTTQARVQLWTLSDLTYNRQPSVSLLHGTTVSNPRAYPASFYSRHGKDFCTSTLVGPKVLFTAAHCVINERLVEINHAGATIRGECTPAPGYNVSHPSEDWALCLLDKPITDVKYERLNLDASLLKVGDRLRLTGFGCTKSDRSGGNDGVYREGNAPITMLPDARSNDIVTSGKVAVCFGDSGGPAFAVHRTKGDRVEVSVNSRGDIRKLSHLASTSTPAAKKFLTEWSAAKKASICGVPPSASGCR